jgi:glycerol-3-phosphate acyltransferase PlsY
VILIDVLKCVIACLLAGWLLPEFGILAKMAAGVATIIGHSYPAAAGFRGGKGILCGAAMAACTDWRVFALILTVFVVTIAVTRYVSLGSVLAAVTFAIMFMVFHWGETGVCVLAVVAAAFSPGILSVKISTISPKKKAIIRKINLFACGGRTISTKGNTAI